MLAHRGRAVANGVSRLAGGTDRPGMGRSDRVRLSMGGWPRAATLTVPNLTLRHAGPTIPGDVNVASAGVTLSVSLFDPTNLRLSLTGPMHVRAGDLPDVIVTGDEASVLVPLQQTDSLSVALHANGLRLEAATGAWHA